MRIGAILLALLFGGCGATIHISRIRPMDASIDGDELRLLSVRALPNETNAFRCTSRDGNSTTVWHVSSNGCPLRADLVLIGPAGSNCVVEWQPELGMPRVVVTNIHVVGQEWCQASMPIPLTGAPQEFSTGVPEIAGFFRLKLVPP